MWPPPITMTSSVFFAIYAALRPFFFSFTYSSAAIRPGAPMIPPPGCVAEPHIQRFRTGVR